MRRNPFMPTFGVSPSVLGGREPLRASFGAGLDGGPGDPRRTLLISGPRGIGKTVMLNELEDEASSHGWVVLRAQPYDLIRPLVETEIPRQLAQVRQERPEQRRITGVTIPGIGGISTETTEGSSPTPSLISSLIELSSTVPGSGVLITLDEVQSAAAPDLWQLTAAVQDLRRDNHNIAFAAAGLPEGIAQLLKHPGTTFLRRAQHAALTPMSPGDTADVLRNTAAEGGVTLGGPVLDESVSLTRGYPFLIQLLGYHLFERAATRDASVTQADLETVTPDVLHTLGQLVHEPALVSIPDSQRSYLTAMAEIQAGSNAVSTRAIAEQLGKQPSDVTMARQALIERELVYSPKHGYLNFLIPHLGHHLREGGVRDLGWD